MEVNIEINSDIIGRLTDWLKSRVDGEQYHRLQDEIAGLQQHLQLKDSLLQQRVRFIAATYINMMNVA